MSSQQAGLFYGRGGAGLGIDGWGPKYTNWDANVTNICYCDIGESECEGPYPAPSEVPYPSSSLADASDASSCSAAQATRDRIALPVSDRVSLFTLR